MLISLSLRVSASFHEQLSISLDTLTPRCFHAVVRYVQEHMDGRSRSKKRAVEGSSKKAAE